MTYTNIRVNGVIIYILRSDGAQIPLDPNNADYWSYVAWVQAGNIPAEGSPPTPDYGSEPDLQSLEDQAAGAISDIGTYLAGADTATAAQVRAEVKAIDQRQRVVIKALLRAVQRTWK